MLPAENIEPVQARAMLADAMQKAMHEFNKQKLEQIKRKITADLVYVNDNPEDAAYWIGYMLSNGFTLSEVENYESAIQNVTLDGVKKAYSKLLEASKVAGTLLPQIKQGGNHDETAQ